MSASPNAQFTVVTGFSSSYISLKQVRIAEFGTYFGTHFDHVPEIAAGANGRCRPMAYNETQIAQRFVAKAIIARRVSGRPKRSSAMFVVSATGMQSLSIDRSLRGTQHAGYGRTRSGLRDVGDSEPVALIERHRSRVGRFKERGAVVGVDAHQTLLE